MFVAKRHGNNFNTYSTQKPTAFPFKNDDWKKAPLPLNGPFLGDEFVHSRDFVRDSNLVVYKVVDQLQW